MMIVKSKISLNFIMQGICNRLLYKYLKIHDKCWLCQGASCLWGVYVESFLPTSGGRGYKSVPSVIVCVCVSVSERSHGWIVRHTDPERIIRGSIRWDFMWTLRRKMIKMKITVLLIWCAYHLLLYGVQKESIGESCDINIRWPKHELYLFVILNIVWKMQCLHLFS